MKIRESFPSPGGEIMVVSLLFFDEVAAALRNPTHISAFDLGRGTSYSGPGTADADALLAFVLQFCGMSSPVFLIKN